eukprot:6605527-Prymnesium_polylepis.2
MRRAASDERNRIDGTSRRRHEAVASTQAARRLRERPFLFVMMASATGVTTICTIGPQLSCCKISFAVTPGKNFSATSAPTAASGVHESA